MAGFGAKKGHSVTISFAGMPNMREPSVDEAAAIVAPYATPRARDIPNMGQPLPDVAPQQAPAPVQQAAAPVQQAPAPVQQAPAPIPQHKPADPTGDTPWTQQQPWAGQTFNGMSKGGTAKKFADGGFPSSSEASPWYSRQEERGAIHPPGLVQGFAGGRTDVHPIQVPSGAYVVPADVTSGLAEGNTMAGSSVIDKMLHSAPYGINISGGRHGAGPPRAPHVSAPGPMARGGKAKHSGQLVPIIVAGGEHIIYPAEIIKKFGSLDQGHKILDKFVLAVRKKTIEDMKKLKGPKR